MGTEEKYGNSNCPQGFCEVDHRGYGGCLDESVSDKDSALARLRGLSLDQILQESMKVQERTNKIIKAAMQREALNEENLHTLKDYMTHEELETEVAHMYERNEMALELYKFVEGGASYSDRLIHEVAVGIRGKKNGSEEARVMSEA